MLVFIWDDKNVEHVAEQAVSPGETEFVLCNAHLPYPMARPDSKFLVWGRHSNAVRRAEGGRGVA
jgi:hypothetical protein